jgi:serine/threonine protein kinase
MNCNNTKCKKQISNYYTCNICAKLFCTNGCLTGHTNESHPQRSQPRNSGTKSTFMKFGDFAKEIHDDPQYNYNNFEMVKDRPPLGAGAFGDVYLARHKQTGKEYALKIMNKQKIQESGATLDIIYREISIHRRITHEGIVKLHSHHEDRQNFYLIMDYVNSGSLFSLIKKEKSLSEKRAFKYFIQAAAAVNFLHMNNLVHRDLKPENLLLDENDNIKLCDFGWCVDLTTSGNRVTFCGTYEYMAPEIIKEVPYDFSIDSWSLGILLYELTHGYSPFRANGEGDEGDYLEIFKNIIKYNFKIERPLSANCQDMIQSNNCLFINRIINA